MKGSIFVKGHEILLSRQDEIIEKLAKEMAEEIDFDVLANLYQHDGWAEVNLSREPSAQLYQEMIKWCNEHALVYYGRKKRWLFKDAKYATMFTLRWYC